MWEAALLFILLGGGATLYSGFQGGHRLLRVWQDAAVSCGLQVVESSSAWSVRLKARTELMEVRIRFAASVQIVVAVAGPADFRSVSLYRQSAKHPHEIEIGDRRFADMFLILGSPRLVLALFDRETRRLLSQVGSEGRLEMSQGQLRLALSSDKVPHVLPLLVDLGRRFARPLDIPRCLAENANSDPEAGVRLQNLLLLIRELPGEPQTVETLRAACSDPSPEIRLRAARELGAEGRGVLLGLAENTGADDVSAEAVSALDRALPFDRVNAILDRARSSGRPKTARACLEALGRSGATAAIDKLVEVLASKDIALATAAAQALGAIGSPAAEPALIQALRRKQTDFQVAAANALARVGSVAAVLPLKKAAAGVLPGELRRAARQAIAEIQSRLQGASPGQLSLAETEAGQLSLADDPAGQLSLGGGEEG